MSKHEPLRTILSDEFRVELQPVEDGPVLTVSGCAHDPSLSLKMVGAWEKGQDEQRVTMFEVTLAQLFDLADRVKKAIQR
jgi:hypothetical protein